jgi:hypothetical protein
VTPDELAAELRGRGILLCADADRLHWSAPPGAMTAALHAQLADHKAALLRLVRQASTAAGDDPGPRPLARDQGVPLSPTQERFWSWMRAASPGHPHFNMGTALLLTGPLDLELLSGNLATVVSRHEALRTVFAERSGQPVQTVLPYDPVPVGTTDLSDLPEGMREAAAEQAVAEAFRYAFDLARGPLLRVSLLRLARDRHVLALVMHHLISDGWSLDVILHELAALGEGARLPPLRLQYADYAVWQRQRVASTALDQQRVFWRRQLSGTARALELSIDHPRPERRTLAGGSRTMLLPGALVDGARRLARQQGATPFMAMLPVLAVVLSSWSGQDDLIIGITTAGRSRVTLEPLVGCFVNTLPVRVSLAGRPSFLELLTRIPAATLAAYAHQDLPFQEIEAMRPPGWHPHGLVQVLYAADSPARAPRRLPGVVCADFPIRRASCQFDLVLDLSDADGGLLARLDFSSQIFSAATADLLLGDLCTTLDRVVARPGEPAVTPGGRRRWSGSR